MQQQFTDKAQKALQLAAKTARDLHQSYIGSEHLLVGLVKEKTGVAAKVLAENGVEESRLLEMIRELIAPESTVSVQERDGYSPRAMKILEESHRQAHRFKSELTGTEHILLAIIREGENVGIRLLNTIGANVQKLYIDILVAMGEDATLYKDDLSKQGKKKKKDATATLNQYSRDLTALAKVARHNYNVLTYVLTISAINSINSASVPERGVSTTEKPFLP